VLNSLNQQHRLFDSTLPHQLADLGRQVEDPLEAGPAQSPLIFILQSPVIFILARRSRLTVAGEVASVSSVDRRWPHLLSKCAQGRRASLYGINSQGLTE
jgi:hypothetical protein